MDGLNKLSAFISWIASIPTEVWVGFGGVLLTAVLTAITSAYFAGREFRKQRRSEAIAVAFKASLIANDLAEKHREFKDAKNKHKAHNDQRLPFWSFIKVKAGRHERITIEPHELLVFIEAREYEIVRQLAVLDMRHKAVCDALNEFADLKRELRSRMKVGTPVGDYMLNAIDVSDEPAQIILTQMAALSQSTANLLPNFSAEALALCVSITPALRRHLKDNKIPFFAKPPS
ncbi:hypothetical protein J5277_05005 [Rhizobium sp. 16-449-1b]|uniref:hypothetical protein n=1 Tax=Rhizobium sp. 16-449-1b TaxID=2819989 RepID=UPI001ADBE952|nr:hypothetical protein [Rhizobium sp. 16-449-1b]MBO9193463.1 hypothetical protein [Rhizobium sp. 16-449-1b]